MVKFKLSFTISAEQVFNLISKLLPIEDMQVEELMELPALQATPPTLIAKHFAPSELIHSKKRKKYHRASKGPQLDMGINRIIMERFADGKPHRATELTSEVVKHGFSAKSIASRMGELKNHAVLKPVGDGTWILAK
jgi:hypothetical protein